MPTSYELCPQTLSRWFVRSIPSHAKRAFLSCFVVGILAYLFGMTNLVFCVGDALTNTVSSVDLVWMGRWSSKWLSMLGTDHAMPMVNGMLMLLALSTLSALTVCYLDIRSGFLAMICGALLTCYPSVGDTFKYLHNADGYMIAAALSVLSLYLLDRYRFGYLLFIPLFALAIGTYQANASLVVALMLVRGVQLILADERDIRALLWLALRYVLAFAAAIGLYYALVGVFNNASGVPLSTYRAANEMGRFSVSTLLNNFINCYADFKKEITFLSFRPDFYVSGYPNYLIFALDWALIWLCFFLCERKTLGKGVTLATLTLLSPMLLCSIRMTNSGSIYSLMTYSVVGMYLLGCVAIYQLAPKLKRLAADMRLLPRLATLVARVGSWLMTACFVVCLASWIIGANLDLYRGKMDYINMNAQCTEYLSRAERTEGYAKHMPIYVIGSSGASDASRVSVALSAPKYYYAFMRYYLAVDMPYGIANEIDDAAGRIAQTDAFRAMPVYPSDGCTRAIDGALVVKLSEP